MNVDNGQNNIEILKKEKKTHWILTISYQKFLEKNFFQILRQHTNRFNFRERFKGLKSDGTGGMWDLITIPDYIL